MKPDTYLSRGVSPTKDEVKSAIKNQSKGLFPGAFCKIIEDMNGDENYCSIMHADGAGTKSQAAYIYYKETGDTSVFKNIAQDSLVMNIDDLLCIGATGNFVLSNTIGRNAHRVSGEIIKQIIEGYQQVAATLAEFGVSVTLSGGETADVGDLVSTIIVDSTLFVRMRKSDVIDCSNIRPGDKIIGLASFGKASYEEQYNSGIGSNGLTAARHILFSHKYAEKYPETFSPTIDISKVYCGPYEVSDPLPGSDLTVGQAILSPTRTYAPILKKILDTDRKSIHGIVHNTGGGVLKCKSFGTGLHYIKDNLFPAPPIFQAIQKAGKIDSTEMFQIFNMGQRLEIYCPEERVRDIIETAKSFNIAAQVIGRVEKNSQEDTNKVTINYEGREYLY